MIHRKSINKEYDQHVLNIGDFDERIFLTENAHQELGTPYGSADELSERMLQKQSLKQHIEETQTLTPNTPLSNRHYLKSKELMGNATPVSSATHTVGQLHSLLLGRKPEPSPALLALFEECSVNPIESVTKQVAEMGQVFIAAYCRPSPDDADLPYGQCDEFAKKRLDLGVTLYYKCLENILNREKKILQNPSKLGEKLTQLLSQEILHVSLFACCMEIILYSYNSQRTFPWIIEAFAKFRSICFQPFHFYKVIELIIRDEDGLSRTVVKHLNSLEEQIIGSMAWKSDSALWDAIKSHGSVPSCQDVALPNCASDQNSLLASPLAAVKKLSRDVFASPLPNSSASDRFGSPVTPGAKRKLFDTTGHSEGQQIVTISVPSESFI